MGLKIDYKFCPQCRRPMTRTAEGDPHCGHCDITVYDDVAAGASALIIRDDHVLLSRRAREPYEGDYDLVGGFMKAGESPEQTAAREAMEETGLTIKISKLLGIYPDQYGENGSPVISIVYIGEHVAGSEQAGDDAAALEWVEIERIPPVAFQSRFQSVRQPLHDLQTWYRRRKAS